MAALAVAQLKAYLRVEHAVDDDLLTLLLSHATALVGGCIGRPITKAAGTWTDEATTGRAYGAVTMLMFPVTPVDAGTVAITDADGTTVPPTDYRVDAVAGLVRAAPGVAFSNGPYTMAAEAGLSAHPAYATRWEPLVNAAILDAVADWYQRRNPAAQAEGTGGGVYTQYLASLALPPRVATSLAPLRALWGH